MTNAFQSSAFQFGGNSQDGSRGAGLAKESSPAAMAGRYLDSGWSGTPSTPRSSFLRPVVSTAELLRDTRGLLVIDFSSLSVDQTVDAIPAALGPWRVSVTSVTFGC